MKKCNNCNKSIKDQGGYWYTFQKKWGVGNHNEGTPFCQFCLDSVKDRDDLKDQICVRHNEVPGVSGAYEYSYVCQHCRTEDLGNDWDRVNAEQHYKDCEQRKKALGEVPKPERERERERERDKSRFNWKSPWVIGGGIVILLVIAVIAWILVRKNKKTGNNFA